MLNKVDVDFCFQALDIKNLDKLSENFSKYDSDNDGRLNKKEFIQWLTDDGIEKAAARKLFYIADSNNEKSLSLQSFEEFAKFQNDMMIKDETDEYINYVYNCVRSRSNHPGGLNEKEFLKFMKLINTPVGVFNHKKVFKQYDLDQNGTIELDEIMNKINFRNAQLLKSDN